MRNGGRNGASKPERRKGIWSRLGSAILVAGQAGAITFGLLFFPKPVRLTPRGRRLPLEHPPHTEVNESKS